MLKGQRKVNIVGSATCISLLLLAFLLVNPPLGSRANALDGSGEETGAQAENDSEPMAQAEIKSSVDIGFTKATGSTSLTPASPNGAFAQYYVQAYISIENSGGYTIYFGSNKSTLTGRSSGATINSITAPVAYNDMPLNSWGYNVTKGLTPGTTFQAIPINSLGDVIDENASTNIKSDGDVYTLSFAAHVGNDKPADIYENKVVVSVVSSPRQMTLADFTTTMQGMTSSICSQVADGDQAQLRDTRDGKYYWVGKLADGKCWMTQNLDLDLSTSTALTPSDSDVATNWTPEYSTATTASSSTILADSAGQRSWSLGNYRITNPTSTSSCSAGNSSAANCSAQFTSYNTPTSANGDVNAHYILGNHYQWNAAAAGTGGSVSSGQATSSICPKGWTLPTGGTSGAFRSLITAANVGTSIVKLVSSPYYFVKGGYVNQTTNYFVNAGNNGRYWSSTGVNANASSELYFHDSTNIDAAATTSRNLGSSVRCVAR